MWLRSASGLPVLAPEVVLLYKSSEPETNSGDFEQTVDHVTEAGRAWLRESIERLYGEHPWGIRL